MPIFRSIATEKSKKGTLAPNTGETKASSRTQKKWKVLLNRVVIFVALREWQIKRQVDWQIEIEMKSIDAN
jgi:hypothetical protein